MRWKCAPEEYACARALATEPGLLLPAEAMACMQQQMSWIQSCMLKTDGMQLEG